MIKKLLNQLFANVDNDFPSKHYWSQQESIELSDEDKRLTKDSVLIGCGSGNVILANNINVLIKDSFEGNLIGQSNNTVTVLGEFKGVLSCHLLILQNPSKIYGTIFHEKLNIEAGVTLGSKLLGKKMLTAIDSSLLEDFDYLRSDEFMNTIEEIGSFY